MNWVIVRKVCCGGLAGGLVTLGVISIDKPEINLSPNYYEHEAPSNYAVPQWHDNIVVAATATSGTVYSGIYNVS